MMNYHYFKINQPVVRDALDYPVYHYHLISQNSCCLFALHWHRACELIVVVSGVLTLSIDNCTYSISQGHFAFVNPGQFHSGLNAENSLCEIYVIAFDMDILSNNIDISKNAFEDIKSNRIMAFNTFLLDDFLEKELVSNFNQMIILLRNKSDYYEIGTKVCLINILYLILSNKAYIIKSIKAQTHRINLDSERIKTVIGFISENYSTQIRIEQMAKLINLSTQHFCRFFKTKTEMSPINYINSFRIEKACEMLFETDKPLVDISMECGFDNLSYFIKQFKKRKLYTPAEYRKYNYKETKKVM